MKSTYSRNIWLFMIGCSYLCFFTDKRETSFLVQSINNVVYTIVLFSVAVTRCSLSNIT